MSEERRGPGARLGIAALNLLWPGLGLLRIGCGRAAAAFMAVGCALPLLLTLWFALSDTLTSATWAALTFSVVGGYLFAVIASAVASWRWSAQRQLPERWWSRWYAMLGIWILLAGSTFLVSGPQDHYRNFYVPAESMAPTFAKNDRFVARMGSPQSLRRGDVVLVRTVNDAIYVKRVAALAGDRVAMRDGIFVVNGRPVPQRFVREERGDVAGRAMAARRLAERFPGERGDHEIYDTGPSIADDMPELTVRAGHVFLLGDNRDHSADSRFPREEQGLGQVPTGDVVGRPLFFSWWPGQRNAGRAIDD